MWTWILGAALAADLSVAVETDDGAVDETVAADLEAKTEKRWEVPDSKVAEVYTLTVHPATWNEAERTFSVEVEGCREWTKKKKSGTSCLNWTLTAREGGSPEDGFHGTEKGDDGTKWGISFLASWSGDAPGEEPAEEAPAEETAAPTEE